MRFIDKAALITAAANGIGRTTAVIMLRDGATLIAVDSHPERSDADADVVTGLTIDVTGGQSG